MVAIIFYNYCYHVEANHLDPKEGAWASPSCTLFWIKNLHEIICSIAYLKAQNKVYTDHRTWLHFELNPLSPNHKAKKHKCYCYN